MAITYFDEIKNHDDEQMDVVFDDRIVTTVKYYTQRITDLENEIEELRNELNFIRKNIIFVREVPFEKAKNMVLNFIRKHKEGIYMVDIAKSLNLDIGVVLKAVSELKEEDKIAKGDERD